ncbi:hypothetical protein CGLO_04959 [Colletotrichum gloeosporioides Cg-14]|uniref:Uncharacterized protein n=1 Tax=Colletotrichum gloeosporioides (strain Cg-14) TaxID=1237896 RepID=T0KR58_COLGC|nr:hypothetical protein CGLO_04959 [Colletotrichum gloeosporioides Cg-14]
MKSVPEDQALQILWSLRSNDDLASVLTAAKAGVRKKALLPDQRSMRSKLPQESSLELELMVKNPTAYPTPKSSLTASERAGLLGPKRLRRSKSLDHQLMALFYQQPGLEYPGHPPVLPIPGVLRSDSPSPGSSSLSADPSEALPPYMGSTFSTLCQFWRILHGVTLSYYKDKPTSLPEHASIDFAEFKYRELLAWIEALPSDQALKDHSPHHVVVLHIWFHASILDLFRPFLQSTARERQRLKTFSARRSYPEAAYNASVNQLKQLVVRYRCNYESSAYTMLWQTALIYVANAVLHNTEDPEWRLYFLACIYGYEGLRTSYRVAEVISRGLLTMSLQEGDMSGSEARYLLKQVTEPEGAGGKGDVRATFMADLDLAMTDPEAAKVENLARRFEDVALFSDFTTMDDEEARRFQRIETPDGAE